MQAAIDFEAENPEEAQKTLEDNLPPLDNLVILSVQERIEEESHPEGVTIN